MPTNCGVRKITPAAGNLAVSLMRRICKGEGTSIKTGNLPMSDLLVLQVIGDAAHPKMCTSLTAHIRTNETTNPSNTRSKCLKATG